MRKFMFGFIGFCLFVNVSSYAGNVESREVRKLVREIANLKLKLNREEVKTLLLWSEVSMQSIAIYGIKTYDVSGYIERNRKLNRLRKEFEVIDDGFGDWLKINSDFDMKMSPKEKGQLFARLNDTNEEYRMWRVKREKALQVSNSKTLKALFAEFRAKKCVLELSFVEWNVRDILDGMNPKIRVMKRELAFFEGRLEALVKYASQRVR